MNRWQERPGLVALVAFVTGGAVAAIVLAVVFAFDEDGGDGDGAQARATDAAAETATAAPGEPGATQAPDGTAPSVTAGNPDQALNRFIRTRFDAEHIGECAQYTDPANVPQGLCSQELYRSEELATFLIGAPFSEGIGEAVITRGEGGWSVAFVDFGPLGETVAVGDQAVVFGAGSCLNFRDAPSLDAEVRSCQLDGTRGQVAGGPRNADGHTWWRLEGLGWASEEFLRPVAP